MTDYESIQDDEIAALQAIYPDDFTLHKTQIGAWKKKSDRAFDITLRPTDTLQNTNPVTLVLHVKFPATYPKSQPDLRITFTSDARAAMKAAAERIIQIKASELLGSEMIYDIALGLQEILDQEDEVNLKTATLPLYEERLVQQTNEQAKAEKRTAEQQKAKEQVMELEKTQILEQIARRNQARSEARQKNDLRPQNEEEQSIPGGVFFYNDRERKYRGPDGQLYSLAAVHNKSLYRISSTARLYTVSPWSQVPPDDVEPFLVLKECRVTDDSEGFHLKLRKLEDLLQKAVDIPDEPSIVQVLRYRIARMPDEELESQSRKIWDIQILMEHCPRGSASDFGAISHTVPARLCKTWLTNLLEGLHFYHQRGLVHGKVHLSNMMLCKSDSMSMVTRWTDGIYGSALSSVCQTKDNKCPPAWKAPERDAMRESGGTAAEDIWDLGICVLQLAFGQDVCQRYPTPQAALSKLNLSTPMNHFLASMLNTNPRKRMSAWDLLHLDFLRSVSGYEQVDTTNSIPQLLTIRESNSRGTNSEYARKFIEEGRLGRGGFGEVLKARNRTDGHLYAVKKIRAGRKNELEALLRETTVLSKLNHPNVVRYFTSWIEDAPSTFTPNEHESDCASDDAFPSTMTSSFNIAQSIPASSRGLDFISSKGITFGATSLSHDSASYDSKETDSDDSESDGESEPDGGGIDASSSGDRSPALLKSERGTASRSGQTLLYIQMEYCKQETLRDLINSGLPENVPETWRLLRQIVHGLAHIHAAMIVHRDLKPENIFVDSKTDLRIGDFGLARPGELFGPADAHGAHTTIGSFTKDVGTAWYVAPELRSGHDGSYDEKVDIFSLGIIFVEMNVAFSTGMERAQILNALALENHELPAELKVSERTVQAQLANDLLQYQPPLRPSSSELLERLPAQDEDQLARAMRREAADPTSRFRLQFVQSLFKYDHFLHQQSIEGLSPNAWSDRLMMLDGSAAFTRQHTDLKLQSRIKQELVAIFHRHGADERTDTSAIFPAHSMYALSNTVKFMDCSARLYQLAYDLILPNAITLANSGRAYGKTFAFGDVYRSDADKFSVHSELNFDLTSANSHNPALEEAECIKVMEEIVDAFPHLSSSGMCLHLNHSSILQAILDSCRVEEAKQFLVKETLSKLNIDSWTWSRIKFELRAAPISLSSTTLEDLEHFDFRASIPKAFATLRRLLHDATNLDAIQAHIDRLTYFLDHLGVQSRIYFCPLASYNEKFYRGETYFQYLFDRRQKTVFAAGGRYDRLIQNHQLLPSEETCVHAVGFQLTWSGLFAGLSNHLEMKTKSHRRSKGEDERHLWMRGSCDVRIECYDDELRDSAAVKILALLWANNISAEMSNLSDTSSSRAFGKFAGQVQDHLCTVLVKSSELVKVHNIKRQDEQEVKISDLVPYIQAEAKSRSRMHETPATKPNLPRQDSLAGVGSGTTQGEMDVKVLMTENKGKKVNRKTIVEEAISHAQSWRSVAAEYPIIAVETKQDVFQSLRRTRHNDAESWRSVIQAANPADRHYLTQIQNMLKEQGEAEAVFLYNFRNRAIFLYPLAST